MDEVALWLLSKDDMLQIIEYMLWEDLREGISEHCAGVSVCHFNELDKRLTLIKSALGELYYKDVSSIAKLDFNDASVQVIKNTEDKLHMAPP